MPKREGASSFEKSLWNFAVWPTLPGGLLFVSEFIDLMISSKDISASQRLKCSLDFFFLIGILQTNSVVAALEVYLV